MEPVLDNATQLLPVAFFDFEDVLFTRAGDGWHPRDVYPLLHAHSKHHRLGVLCNLPPRHDVGDFRFLLRMHGLEAWFEPSLVIPASALPTPLPDRRAFAVAVAIAEAPVNRLTYVTANPTHATAAQESGWEVELITESLGAPQAFADELALRGGIPIG